MKINSHTHIFTLRTVLSAEAVRAMGNRLRHKKIPEYIVAGVEKFIIDITNKPEYLNEDDLISMFVEKILTTDRFKNFADSRINDLPFLKMVNLDSGKLAAKAAKEILDRLSSYIEQNEGSKNTLFNIYQTLRIALMPDSTAIADEFLDHLDPDDALVALMMDIRGEDESERDKRRFMDQISEVKEAALQRPGRVFPFFAVNPHRENHRELMINALENDGFVGVKLYPSIGYEVDHPKLLEVYDYCIQHEVPITMHCSHSGFYVEDSFREYCNPENWKPILEQRPQLKICFAHFGGEQSLSKPGGLDEDQWGGKICALMEEYDNVYADISHHEEIIYDPGEEIHYLETLRSILDHPVYGSRVLFGTDSWLLQLAISDELFWNYYKEKLSASHFKKVTEINPKGFLGVDSAGDDEQHTMTRFVKFMKKNSTHVGALPAAWLQENTGITFKANRQHSVWTNKKKPAWIVFEVMKSRLVKAQTKRGFNNNAMVTMQETKLWSLKLTDPRIFDQECNAVSIELVDACRANQGTPEGMNTPQNIQKKLKGMITNNTTTLLDLANQINTMYHFSYQ